MVQSVPLTALWSWARITVQREKSGAVLSTSEMSKPKTAEAMELVLSVLRSSYRLVSVIALPTSAGWAGIRSVLAWIASQTESTVERAEAVARPLWIAETEVVETLTGAESVREFAAQTLETIAEIEFDAISGGAESVRELADQTSEAAEEAIEETDADETETGSESVRVAADQTLAGIPETSALYALAS